MTTLDAFMREHVKVVMVGSSAAFTPGQPVIADGTPAEIVAYWRNGAWTCRELVHGTTWAVDADRIVPA